MAPIYLDHHAATPLDRRVFEAMKPWLMPWESGAWGNPHSADHEYGWRAEEAVENARRQVAGLIGGAPPGIVFTSGATEANNLALRGLAPGLAAAGRRHILASPFEHPCIEACLRALGAEGFEVEHVPIDASGILAAGEVARRLRPDTGLVTVMAANHEIGTLQPVLEIARLARAAGAIFHSDAAQAAGTVPIDVSEGPDLVTLSAHKLHGPQGIGALWIRPALKRRLTPLILGGGQQGGLRAGTVPVALTVGFGAACELAKAEGAADAGRLAGLRDRLWSGLKEQLPGLRLNGDPSRRLAGNLNITFDGIDAEALVALVRDRVAVSAGAACASARREPSATLKAIGLDDEAALRTIRIGLGRGTSAVEIETAIQVLVAAARTMAG